MKKIIFLLVAMVALSSCEDHKVSEGRKLWKSYLKKNLKDPSSLVIYDEDYTEGGSVMWTIEYGAKNSFGGMGRETLECITDGKKLIIIGGGVYNKEELE